MKRKSITFNPMQCTKIIFLYNMKVCTMVGIIISSVYARLFRIIFHWLRTKATMKCVFIYLFYFRPSIIFELTFRCLQWFFVEKGSSWWWSNVNFVTFWKEYFVFQSFLVSFLTFCTLTFIKNIDQSARNSNIF